MTKFNELLSAIKFLHNKNPIIIYKNLKLENILISKGKVKLADFGWSNY